MKKVLIDFTGAKYVRELHHIIKRSFQRSVEGFPDFYGNNVDALWDCLTGFIETPVEIALTGVDGIAEDLKDEAARIVRVFKRAAADEEWEITFTM